MYREGRSENRDKENDGNENESRCRADKLTHYFLNINNAFRRIKPVLSWEQKSVANLTSDTKGHHLQGAYESTSANNTDETQNNEYDHYAVGCLCLNKKSHSRQGWHNENH